MSDDARVAIACQGGGSHTAFAAGVLKRLIPTAEREPYEIVGLSGASGGAVCAVAAWYGMHPATDATAAGVLDDVWADLSARSPVDAAVNAAGKIVSRLAGSGAPVPRVSPYLLPASRAGQRRLREVLESHVRFDRFDDLAADAPADLFVSTVDVNTGQHETYRNDNVSADAVVASAAVPSLFPAVELRDGNDHWDGLFSHNPPVRRFLSDPATADEKPDEIWVVQINPTVRAETPRSLAGIEDRRNELAGNLSLRQELDFVRQVNAWVRRGKLGGEFKQVGLETIELDDPPGTSLDAASKLDRDPNFIRDLMEQGVDRAGTFLDGR